jgi:2-amino-4-hydroxy-6-hydroxymethyldihydropteridine diphosphokinase
MPTAYILMGGNLGPREQLLRQAQEGLEALGRVAGASDIYETAAWGVEGQPPYLNQALRLETPLSPHNLLDGLQAVERQLGRARGERWQARTMDLDLLFYDADVIETGRLSVPHPRLHLRRFVLLPLAQLAPNLLHPVLGLPVEALLHQCPDALPVQFYLPARR